MIGQPRFVRPVARRRPGSPTRRSAPAARPRPVDGPGRGASRPPSCRTPGPRPCGRAGPGGRPSAVAAATSLGAGWTARSRRPFGCRCPARPACAPAAVGGTSSAAEHRGTAPPAGHQPDVRHACPQRCRQHRLLVPPVRRDDHRAQRRPASGSPASAGRASYPSAAPRSTSAARDRRRPVHEHQRRRQHRLQEDLQRAAGQAGVGDRHRALADDRRRRDPTA